MKLETYKTVKQFVLDLLFPPTCASCGAIGSFLCASCASEISLAEPACFICNARKSSGSICASCRAHTPHLTRVWWAASYDNPHVRAAITQFKYHSNRVLSETLTDYIVASIKKRAQAHDVRIPKDAVLLAVPLHPKRQRARGFNQAELLARRVAAEISLPLLQTGVLMRVKHTDPQAKTGGREKRAVNVAGAFAVHPGRVNEIQHKTIILVDDIATTGSTLNEAARVLKEAGAAHVWGLVVAKG